MKISSGIWRNKTILAPEGKLKPTSDKVRQAFFSSIRPEIRGSTFLDLFAGSGSVGITALSEGAEFAAFVEIDSTTYKALRQNLSELADKSMYQTFRADVKKIVTLFPEEHFDIIFADPFYPDISSLFPKLYQNVWKLLKEGGIFILEHNKTLSDEILSSVEGYRLTKKYGDTALSYFYK